MLKAKAATAACLTAASVAATGISCSGSGCDSSASSGVSVRLVRADNGAPICDATVQLTDGEYKETMAFLVLSDGCMYSGAFERSGTYVVTATAPGFAPAERDGI